MSSIEIAFPNRYKAIVKKRKINKVFDEICRDFEVLSADLSKLTAQQSNDAASAVGDLLSSLEGLRQEIVERL